MGRASGPTSGDGPRAGGGRRQRGDREDADHGDLVLAYLQRVHDDDAARAAAAQEAAEEPGDVMLRDGATTAGHLGDPDQACDTFQSALAGLLRFTPDG